MKTFLFVFLMFLLLSMAGVGLRQSRKDISLFVAVISCTLAILLALFLFTTLYSKAHPVFFVFAVFTLITFIFVVGHRLFRA